MQRILIILAVLGTLVTASIAVLTVDKLGLRQELQSSVDIEHPGITRMKRGIAGLLRDPDSVIWGDFRPYKGGMVVCGSLNQKSIFGGYVGFQHFVFSLSGLEVRYYSSIFARYEMRKVSDRILFSHSAFFPELRQRMCNNDGYSPKVEIVAKG